MGVAATLPGHSAQPEPVPVSAVPASVPNVVIEQFCDEVQPRLEEIAKDFTDKLYGGLLHSLQDYLKDNATFNIGSAFDAARRETVTAYNALRAVEDSTTLQEAKSNAYAARKGYWSTAKAAEYRAEAQSVAPTGEQPA
jgi:hypothetical protein